MQAFDLFLDALGYEDVFRRKQAGERNAGDAWYKFGAFFQKLAKKDKMPLAKTLQQYQCAGADYPFLLIASWACIVTDPKLARGFLERIIEDCDCRIVELKKN